MDNFDEYKKSEEPQKQEKIKNWEIAIGLQQVDGLTPSKYLIDSAKENIEGKISIQEVNERLDTYYGEKANKGGTDHKEEADKVSARIAEILGQQSFNFSPAELISYHKRLFMGILDGKTTHAEAGITRDYDISKKEWVLDGRTILYTEPESIEKALIYDFSQEKIYNYKQKSKEELIEHIAQFISGIWQIHAFGEGNTRTIAVFTIKYLRTFGFEVNNDLFANNSWFFRNSLVRANYRNFDHNIEYNYEYLNRFFGNLLLKKNYTLDNRDLRINFKSDIVTEHDGTVNEQNGRVNKENGTVNEQNGRVNKENGTVNEQNGTVNKENGTVNNLNRSVRLTDNSQFPVTKITRESILSLILKDNKITVNTLAEKLGKSPRTINRELKKLRDNYIITRNGSDKKGVWVILKNNS